MALLAATAPGASAASEHEQLPSGVTPLSYDLSLLPDIVNLKFQGQVRIAIEVKAPKSSIVLNELTLDKAALDTTDSATAIALDAKLQRATLTFAHPVATGRHTLSIDYHGVIGRSPLGFFAMDYDNPAGKRRALFTNFEPASERRFMPSWDEPALKAAFSLSVEIPADRMAVANMPVTSTETLENGQKCVHFARTPRMSTYLYFLGIGDFERISTMVEKTEVGVVVNRGDAAKGRYALGEAAKILRYYNSYFGIPYPLPKLDLVAAPGNAGSTGAMENWGAIFYTQRTLLFDPTKTTESDRQRVLQVVAHEMAHQWFGDLVTMAWWDDLWLNEGFARWMQTKAAEELHPEWKTGLQSLTIVERGKRADARPSTHPIVQPVLNASQAEQAFDNITYDKGAAVIAMLEAYVGADSFRAGVHRYMRAHAYGNTADTDFWREIQSAAGKPVLQMEQDFTRQPGVPLLLVEAQKMGGGATKVMLSQGRFAEDPSTLASAPHQRWHIPVTISAGAAPVTYLLSGPGPATVVVQGSGPVIVNAGQSAYLRTLYSSTMSEALASNMGAARPEDQIGSLQDAWALGEAGYVPVTGS